MIKELILSAKKRGLCDIVVSSIFAEFIGFIVSIFIVRILPREEYGNFAVSFNYYGYISVFIGLGLNNGILQYCSEKREQHQKEQIYRFCLKTGTIFNIILFISMMIVGGLLLDYNQSIYFVLMSGWPIVAYLNNFYIIKLRIEKDNRHYMLINVISSIAFVISAALLSCFWGVCGFVVSYYIKYLFSFILAYIYGKKYEYSVNLLDKGLRKEIIIYSLVCCLTNFASQILLLVDVTCVNFVTNNVSTVASYKAATQIPTALMFIPSSIIVFAYPYIAENNGDYCWLKKKSRTLLLSVLFINMIVSTIIFLLSPVIVHVLWGQRYYDAVPVLRILILNFLLTGTFNMVFGNIIVAIKKVKINLIKTVLCSFINVVLDVILIRKYGSMGAAIATVIISAFSSAFSVVYFLLWLKKKLKV